MFYAEERSPWGNLSLEVGPFFRALHEIRR